MKFTTVLCKGYARELNWQLNNAYFIEIKFVFFVAPTAAPVNLNVVNVSSTSLQATWSAPPINGTHGHIRHYFIKYWGVQCSEITNVTVNGTIQEKTVGPNNFSVMLDGLQFWKCYQVNVTAFTVGEGPYATDLKTRTSENGEEEN